MTTPNKNINKKGKPLVTAKLINQREIKGSSPPRMKLTYERNDGKILHAEATVLSKEDFE